MKIAVVGGGIVGATTAFYLKQSGLSVTLFDEGTGQATKAAAGIISPWLSQRRNQNWYQLARLGAKFYPTLMSDLGTDTNSDIYQQVGTILFKHTDTLLQKLLDLALERKKEAPEIGEVKLLSPREIREKLPLLTPEMDALFISGGARVDGKALVAKLQQRFTEKNGQLVRKSVTSLTKSENSWKITTNNQTDDFDLVVLATGAWLPDLLSPLGYEVDVRGQKGQLVELKVSSEQTNNWPVVMPQGESDIIPFSNGKVLVGATHENELGYDLAIDQQITSDMMETLRPLAPSLLEAEEIGVRVGTRAYTSDFLPFFGPIETSSTLFVASGLGSSGLTTGPIIGRTLASWILNEPTELTRDLFSPANYVKKKL